MKSMILLLSALFFSITSLPGQRVEEDSHIMSLGSQNAFYVDIMDASSSFVEKEWRDYIGQYGKAKKVKKSNEWLVPEAQVLDIGGVNTVNLYALSEETGTGTRQYLWIESGGVFLSSSSPGNPDVGATRLLEEFANKVKVDKITIELDEQQKALDNLEKDLQKLKRDNDNYHKTIEDAKERIAKAESDLLKNIEDQKLRMQEIETQQAVIEGVRDRLEAARNEKN